MTNLPRQLHWQGCTNTRHLGGLQAGTRVTKNNALVRSDNLIKLSLTGQEQLLQAGVTTIIDLRFYTELEKAPNPFATSSRVAYLHRPMMNERNPEAMQPIRDATTTQEAYKATLEGFRHNIAAIITAIAESASGWVVLHCSAGKDRTGLTTALVLRALGVSQEMIAEDYTLTDAYLQATYETEMAAITDPTEKAIYLDDVRAKPEYILETLTDLETRYGSVEAYLQTGGISQESLEQLRQRLLE
jgi:protein-tyrosine phosphatase